MIKIDVTLPIGSEEENRWMAMWGCEPVVFSLETIKKIIEDNPDDDELYLNFDCDGGYVDEGFAIYDYLRTSGKKIHCNIEKGCHSMAIVLLLSAPKENRTAQKHATSLIHCVRGGLVNGTAEEIEQYAEEIRMQEEKILDIYADRTGEDKEILRNLMKEEKTRDAEFLLEHNFIGKINPYNTNMKPRTDNNSINKKNEQMAKSLKEALEMATNCLVNIKNALTNEPSNYDHTDADGNVLFSTEAEDDTLEVGMSATPDGTFELPDGRTIIITDGAIAEIREPESGEDEEVENLRNELAEANARIEELTQQLNEASNCIEELKGVMASNHKPKGGVRATAPKHTEKTEEELREEYMNNQRKKIGIKVKKED